GGQGKIRVQVEVIQVDGLAGAGPVSRPEARKLAIGVAGVEAVGEDRFGPGPKGVNVQFLAVPEELEALKGAAGVGPVERRDEPLRSIVKLLPASPNVDGLVV